MQHEDSWNNKVSPTIKPYVTLYKEHHTLGQSSYLKILRYYASTIIMGD